MKKHIANCKLQKSKKYKTILHFPVLISHFVLSFL